jgi:hypothetical protein
LLLGVLACLALVATQAVASICPPGPNLADLDSDGLDDYACVGDWDNSGSCEMVEDIQAAIDLLDDPGDKLVQLDGCNFAPPVTAPGAYGILELPSFTTLAGLGPSTVLNGFVATDVTSAQAVIANADQDAGNTNITIRDLTIDGGWRGGDATGLGHARMGVRFGKCTNCAAQDLTVKDTLHACLYASNSTQIQFLDSTLERCGNYTGKGSTFPCVYLYAVFAEETTNVRVARNVCDGTGSSAFTTRRGTTNAGLTDIQFDNNIGRNTRAYPNGAPKPCFKISGVGSALYLNNTCHNTSGLHNVTADGYYSDGGEVNASANITVDGLDLTGGSILPPILIQKHAENFSLRHITVNGVEASDCMAFETPLRNFELRNSSFSNCGWRGISQINSDPSGASPDETLTFLEVDISSVGGEGTYEGINFLGPAKGLVLDDVNVNGATSDGLSFHGDVEDALFSELTVSNTEGAGIRVGADSRNLALTLSEVGPTGADCMLLAGSTAPTLSHELLQIDNSTFADCGGRGIATTTGIAAVQDVVIEDNSIDGAEGDGIELALASAPSAGVTVQRNTVRDFGRAADGQDYHGIEVSGNLLGETINDNTLEDLNQQAAHGIYHDVPGSSPSYLCSTTCLGTVSATECLEVLSDPLYGSDVDHDDTVDACDDDDEDGVLDIMDNCVGAFNPSQADVDSDAAGDICDNCVDRYNPPQYDLDSDAEGDVCDLDDGLIYVQFESPAGIVWQLEEPFRNWNVYRGSLDVLTSGGPYTQSPFLTPLADRFCDLLDEFMTDTTLPGPGGTSFYLITGSTSFGEGSLGRDSDGNLRPNTLPCWWTPAED